MALPADLRKLFGQGGVGQQLLVWAVLQQVVGAVLAPELMELQRGVNALLQSTPLTPEQLAEMVVRHIVDVGDAEAYAKQSGITPSDFQRLVQSAGEGPAPGDLAEALRRGIIPERGAGPASTSFEQGMAESHLRDKWADTLKRLAVREPTPADALEALLEGQLPLEEARSLYQRFGGDLEHFEWLFNSRGSAPTPLEASEMARRGIIPWEGEGPGATSFHQAFLEGPWRNKWEPSFRQLAEYRPPPRSIVAMLRSGAIDDQKALELFRDNGVPQDLAVAMVHEAHAGKLASSRDLAKSDIDALYFDQLINADEADEFYRALGFDATETPWLRALVDVRRSIAARNGAISRVRAQYVARHIDRTTVVNALNTLRVPSAQQQDLLATWDIERDSNVKVLSAAEIASAYFYGVIDQGRATAELVAIGYSQWKAWILLSVRKHATQPNQPAMDPLT